MAVRESRRGRSTLPAAKKKRKSGQAVKASGIASEINTALKLSSGIKMGNDPYFKIERIPSGSLVMDRVLGGGFARGRHYELFGDESAGKSYICYMTMILAQKRGEICAIVDPEHSFDYERFNFLGGNSDELLAFHPETAEDGIAVMMMLARHAEEGTIGVVTIDSVSSLVPGEDTEKDVRDPERIGGQARMMSRALRRINTVNRKVVFLWINQTRVNVAVKYGNPETTSGGRALRFYATGRIEMKRGTAIKGKKQVVAAGKLVKRDITIGRWTQIRAVKEKSGMPHREGSFAFNFKLKRIDPGWEILTLGMEDGLIERSSTGRYSYTDIDDHEWKGTEKQFRKYLTDNPELYEEIEAAIKDTTANLSDEDLDVEEISEEGDDDS